MYAKFTLHMTIAAAIAASALATPAAAEHWVLRSPEDTWIWIDVDSSVRKGDLTYFRMDHSASAGVPPDQGGVYGGRPANPDPRSAINCSTGETFSYGVLNANDPYDQWRYDWIKQDGRADAAIYAKLFCSG